MGLVKLVEQKTDYNFKENPLDRRIIETIENENPQYKILWDGFCNRGNKYASRAGGLYFDVLTELYREASDELKRVEKDFPVYYTLSVGAIIAGFFCCFPSVYIGIGGLVITFSQHIYIKYSAHRYIRAWNKYPRENIVESIQRIKEKAGDIIYEYTNTKSTSS